MSSLSSSIERSTGQADSAMQVLRWRTWPLVDNPRWSWMVPAMVVAVGCGVMYLSGNWFAGLVATAALAAALWQFLVPVTYEVYALGFRRRAFGRTRLVPWQAVRSYRPLSTGIVLYKRPDPLAIDALRSLFVPYPADEDELLCALREYLGHAVELP